MSAEPVSPGDAGLYPDGTGGWSGSETSQARAVEEERTGKRRSRQEQVYATVLTAGAYGMTDAEVQDALRVGHGASSGALTRLHRAGLLARITEERDGNQVYVGTAFVGDRATSPYRPRRAPDPLKEGLDAALVVLVNQRAELRRRRTEIIENIPEGGDPDAAGRADSLWQEAAALTTAIELIRGMARG